MNMDNDIKNPTEEILKKMIEKDRESKIGLLDLSDADFRRAIEGLFKSVLRENKISISRHKYEEILGEVAAYFLGLGPLDKLLKDPEISEIMVNGPDHIFIERKGSLTLADITFKDEQHVAYVIEKILSPLGRRVTEFEPFVDARLKDGSRVNIVKAPVSNIGPILTIRKFSYHILDINELINLKTLNEPVAEFLKACIIARLNILISGGASSGKTTLMNALGSFIPDNERVITIEDTRELRLNRLHTVPLETRPPNIEGKGEITIRSLIRNALHMRPDRIIIGEVRSDEVLDMVQAMNTGHEGSMTTLHANSALEALNRLEVLMLLGNPNMTAEVSRRQIISALDMVIQMARFPDGSRRLIQVSEVTKAKEYLLEDIILGDEASQEGLKFTGKIPNFYPKLKKRTNYYCKDFEGKK